MRIGIVPVLDRRSGGIFQYSSLMLQALSDLMQEQPFIDVFVFSPDSRPDLVPSELRRRTIGLEPPSAAGQTRRLLKRILPEGRARDVLRRVQHSYETRSPTRPHLRHRADVRDWFRANGVGLMLYPAPQALAVEADTDFVMAIHDLQHRLQPEFPEVAAGGEWERRERVLAAVARRATLLIADSEVGREDILTFYGDVVDPARVRVLPFLPALNLTSKPSDSEEERVRKKYSLPSQYLFYPAQFWPHKNHLRIVQALARLKEEGLELPIVLSGSCSGALRSETFSSALAEARRGGVQHLVRYIGYVEEEDMPVLYRQAVALIMPTFFGPTNIPILEAWQCDCPVLTSRIRGVREQAGDAAVLVDPLSVAEIADGIRRLCVAEHLRTELIEAGRRRLRRYTPADFRERLKDIIEEAWARTGS